MITSRFSDDLYLGICGSQDFLSYECNGSQFYDCGFLVKTDFKYINDVAVCSTEWQEMSRMHTEFHLSRIPVIVLEGYTVE